MVIVIMQATIFNRLLRLVGGGEREGRWELWPPPSGHLQAAIDRINLVIDWAAGKATQTH